MGNVVFLNLSWVTWLVSRNCYTAVFKKKKYYLFELISLKFVNIYYLTEYDSSSETVFYT